MKEEFIYIEIGDNGELEIYDIFVPRFNIWLRKVKVSEWLKQQEAVPSVASHSEVVKYWRERAEHFEKEFDAVNKEVLYLQGKEAVPSVAPSVEDAANNYAKAGNGLIDPTKYYAFIEGAERTSLEPVSLLQELVWLKHIKDTYGKDDDYYSSNQPKTWKRVTDFLKRIGKLPPNHPDTFEDGLVKPEYTYAGKAQAKQNRALVDGHLLRYFYSEYVKENGATASVSGFFLYLLKLTENDLPEALKTITREEAAIRPTGRPTPKSKEYYENMNDFLNSAPKTRNWREEADTIQLDGLKVKVKHDDTLFTIEKAQEAKYYYAKWQQQGQPVKKSIYDEFTIRGFIRSGDWIPQEPLP